MINKKQNLLLIFLKEPIPGKVKTRLAETVGPETAVRIYQAMVSVLLQQLKWLEGTDYRFCFAPADALEPIQHWILPQLEHKLNGEGQVEPMREGLPSVDFIPQSEGDLGDRLEQAFQQGFDEGYAEVSVIGTDCPFLSQRWIQTAYLAGRKEDVVIGPTFDGGYYYLSLKAFSEAPFRGIPWSSEETFSETMKALQQKDLSCHLLPQLNDIDHEEDWLEALNSSLGAKLKKALDGEG